MMLLAFAFQSLGPTLSVVALVFMLVFLLLGLGVLLLLADLPGRIARQHGHPDAQAVRVAGWLGLPTGIVWVLAMVWAYRPGTSRGPDNSVAFSEQVARLEQAVSQLEAIRKGASR